MFIRAPVDIRAHFFAMSLNNAGDRVTFVDPPAAVANSLGLSLRTAFPHRIANEQTSEDGIFTIILKSGINGTRAPFLSFFLLGTHRDGGVVQVWATIRICFWPTYSSKSMIWCSSLTQACHWLAFPRKCIEALNALSSFVYGHINHW